MKVNGACIIIPCIMSNVLIAFAIEFTVNETSDPIKVANEGCKNYERYCIFIAANSIQLFMAEHFNHKLIDWRYDDLCSCSMPPRYNRVEPLQYLHIPKCGTSFNWYLHNYFKECPRNETHPCPQWMETVLNFLTI